MDRPTSGPQTPGKPYRPSNGTEGDYFQAEYCDRCVHDKPETEDYCDILTRSLCFDLGDEEYPTEWIVGSDGWGMCTAFQPEAENDDG